MAYANECRKEVLGKGTATAYDANGKGVKTEAVTQSVLVCPIPDCGGKMIPPVKGRLFES
jgi:hypothetical protein